MDFSTLTSLPGLLTWRVTFNHLVCLECAAVAETAKDSKTVEDLVCVEIGIQPA